MTALKKFLLRLFQFEPSQFGPLALAEQILVFSIRIFTWPFRFVIRHLIGHFLIAAVLFFILSPFLIFIYKPHLDLVYHLLRSKTPIEITPELFSEKMKENLYVTLEGSLAPGSIRMSFDPHDRQKVISYRFRLKEYPKQLFFHVRTGEAFDQFVKATRFSTQPPSFDEKELVNSKLQIRGRVYQSSIFPLLETHIIDPFTNYAYHQELAVKRFLHSEDFSNPFRERKKYWLVAVNENPQFRSIQKTQFPVFMFSFSLGGLLFYFWRKDRKKQKLLVKTQAQDEISQSKKPPTVDFYVSAEDQVLTNQHQKQSSLSMIEQQKEKFKDLRGKIK